MPLIRPCKGLQVTTDFARKCMIYRKNYLQFAATESFYFKDSTNVAVLFRNRILLHHCVCISELLLRTGLKRAVSILQLSTQLRILLNPTLRRSSKTQHFERCDPMENMQWNNIQFQHGTATNAVLQLILLCIRTLVLVTCYS